MSEVVRENREMGWTVVIVFDDGAERPALHTDGVTGLAFFQSRKKAREFHRELSEHITAKLAVRKARVRFDWWVAK